MKRFKLTNCLLGIFAVAFLTSCTKDVIVKENSPLEEAGSSEISIDQRKSAVVDPTVGWTQQPFNFQIHKPYNLQVSDRYSYESYTNTHTFWTYSTDKAHAVGSTTPPRSEMMIKKQYTSGKHQLEADVYIVNGTHDACIMQVYGGATAATAFMTRVYNVKGGTVKRYNSIRLIENVYDKWWHLNIIHDADSNKVSMYKDGVLLATYNDNGDGSHYFKCGVYGATKGYAKARFRNIKYWTKL